MKDSNENMKSIINEWFARLPKGVATPPYSKSELNVLKKVLERNGLPLNKGMNLLEVGGDSFDTHIAKEFSEGIPAVQGKYSIPENGGQLKLDSKDVEPFNKLFKVKPNSGVGNGEVSLYWLFNYSVPNKPENRAVENRGKSAPDLKIDGKLVEVKSYPSHTAQITLGKFKNDKESRKIITSLFGALNLTAAVGEEKEFMSEVTFGLNDLLKGFRQIIKLNEILNDTELNEILSEYEIFKNLKNETTALLNFLDSNDPEVLAKSLMAVLAENKLELKPGLGQYVVNLLKDDPTDIYFHKIPTDLKKVVVGKSFDEVSKSIRVNSAEIQLKYSIFD